MYFSRVGEHTIKCVITEDEIFDMGYTMDEILSNGERTQEFMNNIFDKAEKEFQMKFDMGIKTVRADFLPNHTLSLTFSEHAASGDMLEHLKSIVDGMINSIPAEEWERLKQNRKQDKTDKNAGGSSHAEMDEDSPVIMIVVFRDMEEVISVARASDFQEIPYNALYKDQGEYYLVLDVTETDDHEVRRFATLSSEYSSQIYPSAVRKAYLEEHGQAIIAEKAIETLKEL